MPKALSYDCNSNLSNLSPSLVPSFLAIFPHYKAYLLLALIASPKLPEEVVISFQRSRVSSVFPVPSHFLPPFYPHKTYRVKVMGGVAIRILMWWLKTWILSPPKILLVVFVVKKKKKM